jgi:hypothetical protein
VPNPTPTPAPSPAPATQPAPDLSDLAGGAGVGQTVGIGGYLDNPIPISTVRLRFDAAYNVNRPDRSEFFWASWKELGFHPHPIAGKGGGFRGAYFDPKARGPEHFYGKLDYQEILPYLELAISRRTSVFVELPTRFVEAYTVLEEGNPASERQVVGPNAGKFFPEPREENTERVPAVLRTSGFSDMNAGFKYALIADPARFLTFQFRTYIPTGDPSLGLGTGHVSLEPGLLLYQRLTSRLVFQGQLRDWIPISNNRSVADPGFTGIGGGVTPATGKRFDGNILIYGIGAGYDVIQRGNFRVTPIAEFVGWTVFNGLETVAGSGFGSGLPVGIDLPTTHSVHDVSGTTIINAKFGVRTSFWNGHSIYAGYGHALTGARWYKDIFRLEYRILF